MCGLRGRRKNYAAVAEREGEKVIWRVDVWVGKMRSAVAAEQEKMVEKFCALVHHEREETF